MLAFASLLATVTSADGGASPSAPPALQLGFSAVQFGLVRDVASLYML